MYNQKLLNFDLQMFAEEADPTPTVGGEPTPSTGGEPNPSPEPAPQPTISDVEAGRIRRTAEKEILERLGLTDKNQLAAVKQAYQSTLTKEEKTNQELVDIKNQLDNYKAEAERNAFLLEAREAAPNKTKEEIEKIVLMAKGLVTEEIGVSDAIKAVVSMLGAVPTTTPVVPKGNPLDRPPAVQPTTEAQAYAEQIKAARETNNTLQVIRIKNEAASKGIYLN